MELKNKLVDIFHNDYPGIDTFIRDVIIPVFGDEIDPVNRDFMDDERYRPRAERAGIKSLNHVANITEKNYNANEIALFDVTLDDSVNIERARVNIQSVVRSIVATQSHILILFHYENAKDQPWRFSYAFKQSKSAESTSAKRYTYVFGKDYSGRTAAERFEVLAASPRSDADFVKAFSVEALTKEFYDKLFKWYLWATNECAGVTFPNDPTTADDDRDGINVKIIRWITRLLFCWFIKQKGLIPNSLFSDSWCRVNLRDFDFGIGNNPNKCTTGNFDPQSMTSGNYYAAVLQNLFFATLNTEISDRGWAKDTHASYKDQHYGVKILLRDNSGVSFFTEDGKNEFEKLLHKIPYLNGGLFECQDKMTDSDTSSDNRIVYFDGFSRDNHAQKRAFLPNALFFNPESEGDKMGIFTILSQYNFTVDENATDDIEVSLDPELLGKVFENLLASYNPETKETARKQTGSFYTPREIVNYMVNESLVSYLGSSDTVRNFVVNGKTEGLPADIAQKLKSVKILDPACGSGAFPMGCLLKINSLLQLLEPDTSSYERKLEIISNCIYGVDIQPIAMLISKLRFFISLLCEQDDINLDNPDDNFGVNPLPNLETKFVAANTLCAPALRKFSDSDEQWYDDNLKRLRDELAEIRRQQLNARTRNSKLNLRHKDRLKCKEIQDYIKAQIDTVDTDLIARCEAEIEQLSHRLETEPEKILKPSNRPDNIDLFGESTPNQNTLEVIDNHREIKKRIAALKATIKKEQEKSKPQAFEKAVDEVTRWNPYDQNVSSPFFDPEWMFGIKDGFDIVIGNPPYISTKGVTTSDKKLYEAEFGFSDDTYNLFFFKGHALLAPRGCLCYITPKTFWTTQTKRNLRDLILSNKVCYIFDTANPFESAMVDTCITSFIKAVPDDDSEVLFLDGSKDLSNPEKLSVLQKVYLNTQNSVIFKPSELNMKIYNLYGEKVKELYEKWWDKIKTSRDIEKNKQELEQYRASLKPGDIALLGCLTEGGQGLATANNGKYIAVRKKSKWAKNILVSRSKKLSEFLEIHPEVTPESLSRFDSVDAYLSSLKESEIATLFDGLKEQYGRDIFGQGYIYRLIEEDEIADINTLTKEEKENGISPDKPFYVPYDKGDKDGNRWYLETPFAIAWTRENVHFLKTNSGKKGQGMPVVRNPQFYFSEGLCWSDINTVFLKCRKKQQSVHDVKSMSIFAVTNVISEDFIMALINTQLFSYYVDTFVNNTQTFQINDARQLPIIIPNETTIQKINSLVMGTIDKRSRGECVDNLEKELEVIVRSLYGI